MNQPQKKQSDEQDKPCKPELPFSLDVKISINNVKQLGSASAVVIVLGACAYIVKMILEAVVGLLQQ